jgi:proton glutamate symport protein
VKRPSPAAWLLIALAAGAAFGAAFPRAGAGLEVLGSIFLRLINAVIAPLMFASLVAGVAGAGSLRAMGRVGLKAAVLFQVLIALALAIGAGTALVLRPGRGVGLGGDASAVPRMTASWTEILQSPFPASVVDAMARGDVLQIVVFALLFGMACAAAGEKAAPVVRLCEALAEVMFRFTHFVMYFAPVGIFGAVAAAVGGKGVAVLLGLGKLVGAVYAGLAVFVLAVLWPLLKLAGAPLGRFMAAVREPFVIAFSTTSSNVALPVALENMEKMGVPRHIAALVLPASMSFNTTGSALFLALATVFVAQAAGVALSAGTLALMLTTLMLTTKGIGAVPRGSLVILAGTLTSFGLPLEGVAVILGVDQLMDMARTSVNMLGHCLSAAAIARWERATGAGSPRVTG